MVSHHRPHQYPVLTAIGGPLTCEPIDPRHVFIDHYMYYAVSMPFAFQLYPSSAPSSASLLVLHGTSTLIPMSHDLNTYVLRTLSRNNKQNLTSLRRTTRSHQNIFFLILIFQVCVNTLKGPISGNEAQIESTSHEDYVHQAIARPIIPQPRTNTKLNLRLSASFSQAASGD